MTAKQHLAGAVSHQPLEWYDINWHKIQREVQRLQARITQATQAGKWGKVKALQHLLTHSFAGRALAVRKVTENQGKNTPGVDKVIWNTPAKKAHAVETLRTRGYKPLPLRRVYILKSDGKSKRPLSIPSMQCRARQTLYLLALDPVAEATADLNSYGFRHSRSCADAIQQAFTVLSGHHRAEWILEGDIRSCFDKISHEWLLANIPMDKAILKKWLKVGFIDKNVFHPTEEGTPQGGPASPVIANLTLDGLEKKLQAQYPKNRQLGKKAKVNFIRFADDFIVTGSSKELLEQEVKPLIEQFLSERGLELSATKTKITHIKDGFDFLGQTVRKYPNGKVLTTPAKKKVASLLNKIRAIIKGHKQTTAGDLIEKLNPIIRGWVNYHRHAASKRTFSRIDNEIMLTILRWVRRRHPHKTRMWLKKRYFCRLGTRDWIFFGYNTRKKGNPKKVYLIKAAKTPIKRHIKIQSKANPYDPTWETYFERRLDVKMANDLRDRKWLLYLWKEQHGLCPVCNHKITKLTGWHSHHIVWRVNGGGDELANRVLLHPDCHIQVHNRPDLTVVKPRPDKGR